MHVAERRGAARQVVDMAVSLMVFAENDPAAADLLSITRTTGVVRSLSRAGSLVRTRLPVRAGQIVVLIFLDAGTATSCVDPTMVGTVVRAAAVEGDLVDVAIQFAAPPPAAVTPG